MAEPVTLARPYAKASFQVALAQGALSKWEKMLDTAAAVVTHPKMGAVLTSPSLTAEQQSALLLEVCGEDFDEQGKNLIRILAAYRRLVLLPEISVQFHELKALQEKTVEVSISSAFELDPAISERLAAALAKKWGCQVQLGTTLDKSLLGGVVIKAGDNVIDASIRGRIQKLAEVLGV